MSDYSKRNFIMCVSPHKDFDEDPTAASTNDWTFIGTAPTIPMPKHENLTVERSRNYREPYYTDVEVHDRGVAQEIELPEFDVTKEVFQLFCAAFFQNAANAGVGPFTHKFQPPTIDPDFAADAGWLLHFMAKHPAASKSFIYANCIVTQLKIKVALDSAVGNRLTIQPTLLARKSYQLVTPFSTTISYPTESFWLANTLEGGGTDDSYIEINTDTPELFSAEITLVNGGGGENQDSDGRPRRFKLPYFTGNGNFRVKKNSDTESWIADIGSSSLATATLYWQADEAGATAGDLKIDWRFKFDAGVEQEEGDVEEEILNFPVSLFRSGSYGTSEITTADNNATVESIFT